jgi:hypothetical protein
MRVPFSLTASMAGYLTRKSLRDAAQPSVVGVASASVGTQENEAFRIL